MVQSLLICYGTITIPPDDLYQEIISENYDSLIGGHKGVTETYRRIRKKFFSSGLKADITEHIRNCPGCEDIKLVWVKNREPMIITDTPVEPFDKISIKTVVPLPITQTETNNPHHSR